MQDKAIRSLVEQDNAIDEAIMGLLLIDAHGPLSDGEVAREIGDEIAAEDSLSRLARGGLIHRLDGFVFATRSAALAADLAA